MTARSGSTASTPPKSATLSPSMPPPPPAPIATAGASRSRPFWEHLSPINDRSETRKSSGSRRTAHGQGRQEPPSGTPTSPSARQCTAKEPPKNRRHRPAPAFIHQSPAWNPGDIQSDAVRILVLESTCPARRVQNITDAIIILARRSGELRSRQMRIPLKSLNHATFRRGPGVFRAETPPAGEPKHLFRRLYPRNLHFPSLRSDPMALSGASRREQIPSSDFEPSGYHLMS
jgi:hypothetical protein